MAQPMVSGISPTHGAAGTAITITGTEFGALQGGNSYVTIAGLVATVQSWSDTSIVVTNPADAISGDIIVYINYQAYGGLFSNP